MAIVTAAEVRKFVPTDLDDAALGILIDDADAEILERCGSLDSETETHARSNVGGGQGDWLHLRRRAASITSITERRYEWTAPAEAVVLAANDWTMHHSGRSLHREPDGDNANVYGWGQIVTVVHVPAGADSHRKRRRRAAIDLVQLAIRNEGLGAQTAGNHRVEFADYERERSRILRRLRYSGGRMPLA